KSRLNTLPGAIPLLEQLPIGCRLGPRCPYAQRECIITPRLTGAGLPMTEAQLKKLGGRELRALGKLMPGEKEVAENPRARSSVL
ncbi:hypothetical protein MJM83_29100, partial [Salmonella enterica subsp. enterica serovar Montevideo]|nr:hypothetical protein [Salmonella enterica subsp. enterica serovar Montevideo]